MNKIIVLTIVLVLGWYGNILYKQNKFPFLQNTKLPFMQNTKNLDLGLKTKCITKDGRVLYGTIPEGTICDRRESFKDSITIVPSKTTNYSKDTNSRISSYSCDRRKYCSQMTSRAEAEFFIKNCPNTKMDGDNDGIPCENDSRF